MTNYRSLIDKEIATLTVYGCSAENWKTVQVVEDFSPSFFYNVHFSGNVYLGTYTKVFELPGGVKKHAGIYNCVLHNCTVENNVFIDKIHNYIANYIIGEGSYIENVDLILVDGLSSFGNGIQIPIMNEAGGREIPIFDHLSAPMAYMLTAYRYLPKLTQELQSLINNYTLDNQSEQGIVGQNVHIINSGSIKNVRIGDFSTLEGVTLLENGTINSNEQAPVTVGFGVECNNFIISSGATVTDSTQISNCFIGQGCLMGKGFSALDSVFFANCQGLLGEATAIFAGPYTVTHHKSSMLLAGMFSFFNAGSGTNQSNHMYKLGPVHQGITERGVKTSSDSYLMWPAKIGAFTVVLGRHKGNPDISELPFSYLIENDGESNLLPGINLHSSGTIRDIQKWPKRDNRTDEIKLDPINFNFLTPYSLSKALKGIEILTGLLKNLDEKSSFVWYQNCKIKRSSIKKGIELYEMAINQFVGEKIIEKIIGQKIDSKKDLSDLLFSDSDTGLGDWVDMAGLIAPQSEVDRLITLISAHNISLEAIQLQLNDLNMNYNDYSWNWAKNILENDLKKPLGKFNHRDIISIIEKWLKSALTFDDLILRDAKKEFNTISKTGYGLDGTEDQKQLDFKLVRGSMENNSFISDLTSSMKTKTELANELITKLTGLN